MQSFPALESFNISPKYPSFLPTERPTSAPHTLSSQQPNQLSSLGDFIQGARSQGLSFSGFGGCLSSWALALPAAPLHSNLGLAHPSQTGPLCSWTATLPVTFVLARGFSVPSPFFPHCRALCLLPQSWATCRLKSASSLLQLSPRCLDHCASGS